VKFFLFCSPHYYYIKNLMPIAQRLRELGHDVVFSSQDYSGKETVYFNDLDLGSPLSEFKKGVKFDVVLLTQCWWLEDKVVADICNKRNTPFYILEHAPQMVQYRVVKYRTHLNGARAHFMWGNESQRLMRESGCKELLPVMGAPRLSNLEDVTIEDGLIDKYSNGRKIISVYTTSEKMMSPGFSKSLNRLKVAILANDRYNLVLKDHVKFSSDKLVSDTDRVRVFSEVDRELEFLKISDYIIFCFPSSVMIPAAFYKKKMFNLYHEHNNKSICKYADEHKNIIPALDIRRPLKSIERFSLNEKFQNEWLERNLYIESDPSDNIINYVLGDI